VLHGCVVEDDALIAMIRKGSLIAAGALVAQGDLHRDAVG
jgi:carbonic anhydrase/acetyltransferase-like protein (isoleucine patch superfamily)